MNESVTELSYWEFFKVVLRLLLRREEAYMSPEQLLSTLRENGLQNIRVTGRGGIEISTEELKNSEEFKRMEAYALQRVKQDIASLRKRGFDIK